jgi:hypothetical protein
MEIKMTESNFNTLKHSGMYQTRVERQEDGGLTLVQINQRGDCDCVILPADLVTAIMGWLKPSRKRRAA